MALNELDELAELNDQKWLFTDALGVTRTSEFPDYAIEVAWVGADGGHLGGMVVDFIVPGRHFW